MTKIGDKVRVRRCKDLLCEFVEPHDKNGAIEVGHTFAGYMFLKTILMVMMDTYSALIMTMSLIYTCLNPLTAERFNFLGGEYMRLEKSVFFFKRYLDLLEKIKEINSPHAYLLFRYIMKRIAKCRPKTTHMEDIISECERQNVNPITFIKFVMP